jgi:hypothetical protein
MEHTQQNNNQALEPGQADGEGRDPGRMRQAIQERVLAHMRATERGLRRADAARDNAGLAAFAAVLGSLRLSSLDQVDNLKTLQEIVAAL